MRSMIKTTQSRIFLLSGFLILVIIIYSCGSEEETKHNKKIKPSDVKEPLIEANKKLLKSEEVDIADFIRRHKWEMQKTGSGLRYQIIRFGEGKNPKENDLVTIRYQVYFLTGDMQESDVVQFVIGKQDVISGLHQAVLLMKGGGKARFIIPSHLAYGLTGKPGKIPPKTTLIYEIELINIK